MASVAVFSPAKINLFLAVTGRRADGFHDLISLVAPLDLGDTVWVTLEEAPGGVALTCDAPGVPTGADNLAVRAAEAWRRETGETRGVRIDLKKRIPMGAGLGGGSSNAVAVLLALDALAAHRLDAEALARLAAGLGSDCPLFLAGAACLMRGRGERLEPLAMQARARITGRRVLVFKPDFPVGTAWAYGRLAADGAAYMPAEQAEATLAAWIGGDAPADGLLFNSFERVVFGKFQALPVLIDRLRARRGVEGVLLSGSGSACFVLLGARADVGALHGEIREALGDGSWIASGTIR